jgi:hypothetical protein
LARQVPIEARWRAPEMWAHDGSSPAGCGQEIERQSITIQPDP